VVGSPETISAPAESASRRTRDQRVRVRARVLLSFRQPLVREINCTFLLRGTLGEPLKDPDYFRQVRVDDDLRTVVWPNGLDPSPELLDGSHDPDVEAGDADGAAA